MRIFNALVETCFQVGIILMLIGFARFVTVRSVFTNLIKKVDNDIELRLNSNSEGRAKDEMLAKSIDDLYLIVNVLDKERDVVTGRELSRSFWICVILLTIGSLKSNTVSVNDMKKTDNE